MSSFTDPRPSVSYNREATVRYSWSGHALYRGKGSRTWVTDQLVVYLMGVTATDPAHAEVRVIKHESTFICSHRVLSQGD